MIIFANEDQVKKIVRSYYPDAISIFSLAKKKIRGITANDVEFTYSSASGFMPSEDDIQAVKDGAIKLKKLIARDVKLIHNPIRVKDMEGQDRNLPLNLIQVVTMATSDSKKRHTVVVFLLDPEDNERNRIVRKYLRGIFGEYGLSIISDGDTIDKLFGGKKKGKVWKRVSRYVSRKKSGCLLSDDGMRLKKMSMVYHAIELQASRLVQPDVDDDDIGRRETEEAINTLLRAITGENLKSISSKKVAKRLAEKDKLFVKSYNSFRNIVGDSGAKAPPKAKYGQKKGKNGLHAAADTKKIAKYFSRRRNRVYLRLLYCHLLSIALGYREGSKQYTANIRAVMSGYDSKFVSDFVGAVNRSVEQPAAKKTGTTGSNTGR